MNEEKKILSVEDILLDLNRRYKTTFYVLIAVWVLVLFFGYRLNTVAGTAGVGVVISGIIMYGTHLITFRERCIENKRLEVKEDIVDELKEVMRRDRFDYYAVLKKAGTTDIQSYEYRELTKDEEVYVFEYLNKKGKCYIRDIYSKNEYKLSPDLLEYCVRD